MRPGDVWHGLLTAYGNLAAQFSTALENAFIVRVPSGYDARSKNISHTDHAATPSPP